MNPLMAIDPCEKLVESFAMKDDLHSYMAGSESLACALTEMLREANESNDAELIRRVLDLQDRFIDLGVSGIENVYTDFG